MTGLGIGIWNKQDLSSNEIEEKKSFKIAFFRPLIVATCYDKTMRELLIYSRRANG